MNKRMLYRLPAAAALSACLLFFPASCPAADSAGFSAASGSAAAKAGTEYSEVAPDLARRVREKAAFLAKTEPALWIAGYRDDRDDAPWERQSRRLADRLWQLRFDPELMNAQKALLLTPLIVIKDAERRGRYQRDEEDLRQEERRRRVRNLEDLVDQAARMARNIQTGERKAGGDEERSRQAAQRDASQAERIRDALDRAKDHERRFAFALSMLQRLNASGGGVRIDSGTAFVLWRLRDRPEDSETALAVLKERKMNDRRREALLQKLVDNPARAREEFANLTESLALQNAYAFLMDMESPYELISLPLGELSAKAAAAVEKAGAIPLAAKPVAAPAPALTLRRMTELLPKDMRESLENGKQRMSGEESLPSLPFLQPGERLYMVVKGESRAEGAAPVVAGTPLGALDNGPCVVEYVPANAHLFSIPLTAGTNSGARWYARPMLLAAACSPQEMAAHLFSLMAMKTERERSLFGPFEAYAWKPGERENRRRSLDGDAPPAYPRDVPGSLLRLVKVTEQTLFTALAPQADPTGLARLMGPIRGVWAYEGPSRDTSWLELRYAPKAGTAPAAPLGKAPALSLEKPALENIVARERAFVTLVLAWNIADGECSEKNMEKNSAECASLWPNALARTRTVMAELADKGFISPIDAAMPVYLLDRHKSDADLTAKLRTIIDDTTKAPAARAEALRKAVDESREKQPRENP